MSGYLKTPDLPEKPVRIAVIGGVPDVFEFFLRRHAVTPIVLEPNPAIDSAISDHADAQVFHAGQGKLFADARQLDRLADAFHNASITPCRVSGAYPGDCALNVLRAGNVAFANTKAIAPSLSTELKQQGVRIVHVNQGYANCAAVVIAERAIMTDDLSVAAAAAAEGFDVLSIGKGDVRLPGHDCGFIGGAAAMIAPRRLLFFGDVTRHRDFDQIQAFLAKYGCAYDCLPGVPLTDVGGIVPVC
ncbi:MAG: hypothetical protein IKN72_02565 [Clostridia bacterium]|nr:hypothetical protein [Clostridia bacterium]